MTRSRRVWVLGVPTAIVACALCFVPRNWVESWLGMGPDHGNGLVESLFIVVPIVLLTAIAISCGRRWKSRPPERRQQ
jgi:hypothetical protein